MNYTDWLSEANDRLTRVMLRYPDAGDIVEPIRAYVRFALARPEVADLEQTVKDTKGRMIAASVNYPFELEEEFMPVVEKAIKAWGS